jgi:plastocyanin
MMVGGADRLAAVLGLLAALAVPGLAAAEDAQSVTVVIKDHRFEPAEIKVAAGKPTVLLIRNQDPTPEEFDSSALKVEKVVAGGAEVKVRLRPLEAGRYEFVGEYHEDTAKGAVIAE